MIISKRKNKFPKRNLDCGKKVEQTQIKQHGMNVEKDHYDKAKGLVSFTYPSLNDPKAKKTKQLKFGKNHEDLLKKQSHEFVRK